jgi:hypothetical protein
VSIQVDHCAEHRPALPRLVISDGALEGLKWLGLVLMTVDHVNKYLFNGANAVAFAAGRLAMPIFVFVLAYNLARPDSLARGAYQRTMIRLGLFGLLATPAYVGLGGLIAEVYPLNILFTLLVATAVLYLLDRGATLPAVAVFGVGGTLVEFWWPALSLCLAVWFYTRSPDWRSLALGIACCGSLQVINGNAWALVAVPVCLAFACWKPAVPRWRWVFYACYPLHLTALWLTRLPMANAGYLFF